MLRHRLEHALVAVEHRRTQGSGGRGQRQMLDHNKNARASRLFRLAALTRIECFDRAASYTGPFYFLGITCRIITTVLPAAIFEGF